MKLRGRRKKSKPKLMLTSLLDMFTIILIFLIVSFEAEDFEFRLEKDVSLPESQARSIFKPAVNVAISKQAVVVDQRRVLGLKDGLFEPGSLTEDDEIPSLVEALRTVRERTEGENDDRIIMLQADKDLSYRTLYLVMRAARVAGFEKYRLAVMKK